MHIPDSIDVLEHRIAVIDQHIAKIDQDLAERQTSSQNLITTLTTTIETYRTALTDRQALIQLAGDPDYRRAKALVQQWLRQAKQHLSQEEICAWNDQQQLLRERRELERERAELAYALTLLTDRQSSQA